jgi:glutamate 5-kinase
VLDALLAGERVGTLFQPSPTPLPDRKGWLAHALLPKGSLQLDAGAERALTQEGASLLAVGVQAVVGDFERREAVRQGRTTFVAWEEARQRLLDRHG